MYVYRPQSTSSVPSRSSAGTRGPHHHAGRQAAKNQRRTQPKPRRPQAQQRRRHLLRDLACHVRHRPRLAAEPMESGSTKGVSSPVASFDDLFNSGADFEGRRSHGSRRRGGVRARLCARLLERSCAELAVALERRHGEIWPDRVLRGDLNAVEGMRRICEGFCLRPELEEQVLRRTVERARSILDCQASAPDSICPAPSADIIDQKVQLASDCELVSPQAPEVSSGIPAADEECRTGSSSESEASDCQSWRASWRTRALRVLGLERLWRGLRGATGASAPTAVSPPAAEPAPTQTAAAAPVRLEGLKAVEEADVADEDATSKEVEEEEDEDSEELEERALSSKLVAAVRNAELHAAKARSRQGEREGSQRPCTTNVKVGKSTVRFARESTVSFFSLPVGEVAETATALEYRRSLETKVFDGPSGHKAKRTSSTTASSSSEDEDEGEPSTPEEEAEEWEDHCDDIAELMSQQRSGLLWSSSW